MCNIEDSYRLEFLHVNRVYLMGPVEACYIVGLGGMLVGPGGMLVGPGGMLLGPGGMLVGPGGMLMGS